MKARKVKQKVADFLDAPISAISGSSIEIFSITFPQDDSDTKDATIINVISEGTTEVAQFCIASRVADIVAVELTRTATANTATKTKIKFSLSFIQSPF